MEAIRKNTDIKLEIEDISSEGTGVGRHNGVAVFVAGAAKGDTVLCRIIKAKKNYCIGKLLQVLKPSADRCQSDCRAFPACGGCAFRHINYEAELEHKSKRVRDAFLRLAHIELCPEDIVSLNPLRYRNKAQYPVRMQQGKLCIGFYANRSHRVIDARGCLLQPEEFAGIIEVIRGFLLRNPISIYDEATHKGLVRHIYLRKAFATDEIMVCLVINGETLPKSEKLTAALLSKFPQIKSIVLNINREDTNVILGRVCKNLYGNGYIEDVLCSVRVRISPLSFYQVNRAAAELLYQRAAEFALLKKDDVLLDLYCGAGTIGLSMADKVKQVIGVELVPQAISDAKNNAEINNITNARFICADASEAARRLKAEGLNPSVIVIDPPRKGCDSELIHTIGEMSPDRLVYISCDPATLARDSAILKEIGYEIKRLTPFDLFPRTTHVETVVLMSKDDM